MKQTKEGTEELKERLEQTKELIKIAVFKAASDLEEKEEYRNYYRRRYETAVQKYEQKEKELINHEKHEF